MWLCFLFWLIKWRSTRIYLSEQQLWLSVFSYSVAANPNALAEKRESMMGRTCQPGTEGQNLAPIWSGHIVWIRYKSFVVFSLWTYWVVCFHNTIWTILMDTVALNVLGCHMILSFISTDHHSATMAAKARLSVSRPFVE